MSCKDHSTWHKKKSWERVGWKRVCNYKREEVSLFPMQSEHKANMAWHFLLCTNPVSKKTLSYRTITLSDTLLALVSRACVLIVDMALMWVFDKKSRHNGNNWRWGIWSFWQFWKSKMRKTEIKPGSPDIPGWCINGVGIQKQSWIKGAPFARTEHTSQTQETGNFC